MKDIVVVISLLVAVGLSVVVVRLGQKAEKAGKSLEDERYSRMVAEETLQKKDAKLTTFQEEIKEDQDKMTKIVEILQQEKSVNQNLKKQYDELTAAKTDLESKLDSVLHEKAAAEAALQVQAQAAQAKIQAQAQAVPPANTAQPAAVQPAAASTAVGH